MVNYPMTIVENGIEKYDKKENGNRYQFRIEQKDDVMLVREQQERQRTRAKETDNLLIRSRQIGQWDIQDRSCIC